MQDWRRHKPECKPTGTVSSETPESTDKPETKERSAPLVVPSRSRTLGESLRDDGREVQIDIPGPGGRTTTITSKTISPEFMKEFRDHAERLMLGEA